MQPVRLPLATRMSTPEADQQKDKATELIPPEPPERSTETAIRAGVLEQVGEGVVLADTAGRITFVNEAARRLHGVATLGVGVEGWSETYHLLTMDGQPYPPEELPLARALLQREMVRDALWRIQRTDGSQIVAQGTATPLTAEDGTPLGAVLVLRDVTQLHESAAALKESEDHYRHSVELNPQMPWTAGPEGAISDFSQRWLDLTGLTREQALGSGWAQVPHPDDLPAMAEAWTRSVSTGEPYDMEHRIRSADGTYRWMRSRAFARRDEAGQIVRWYGTTEDIEQRKQDEIERERLLAEVKNAAKTQRRFLREMLLGFTEGTLRLCDDEDDLPLELAPMSEPVDLTAAALRVLRRRAQSVAEGLNFPLEKWQDLETSVGEAAMNAVCHAGGGDARVHADVDTGVIQVWIRDHGPGIAGDLIHRAVERHWTTGGFGQGFWLILKTCDRVYLLTGPTGTTVVLEQERQETEPAWLA